MLSDKMTVGQRFKRYRTEKGLSQTDVSEGICSFAMVSLLENDKKVPSARIMGQLAERLGVPLREIMGKDETGLDVEFQIAMIRVYMEMGDHTHALKLAEDLYQRNDLLQHQERALMICRVECLGKTGKNDEVIELLLPFLKQQGKMQDLEDQTLCDAFNKLGNAYFKLRDFEKAYAAYERGYSISVRFPVFDRISAQVAYNLGVVCRQLGYKDDAKRYLEKAHTYYSSVSDTRSVADSLFFLSLSTGDGSQLLAAHALYSSLNLVREANLVKQHYAFYVESKKDYKKALEELERISAEFTHAQDYGMSVHTLSRAALICVESDDCKSAEKYLQEAERVKQLMSIETELYCADFYKARAMYHLQMGNFERCILDSHKSSEMCDKMGLYAESAMCLEISSKAYHQRGMDAMAYQVSTKVIELLRRSPRGMEK